MKSISSINSWIIGIAALIITGFMSYRVGLFFLDYPVYGPILLLIFIAILIVFLLHPKFFVYFIIIFFPLINISRQFLRLELGDVAYLSITLAGVLKLGALSFAVLFLFLRRTRIFKYELSVPILILLRVLMIGVLISPSKLYSLRVWTSYAAWALLYFVVLEVFNDIRDVNRLLKYILFSFTPFLIFGYWQIMTGLEIPGRAWELVVAEMTFERIGGGMNVRRFGFYLVFFQLLAVFLFFEMRNKWLYITLFAVMMVLLFKTYARSAWMVFLVAFSVEGALRYRKFYLLLVLMLGFVIVTLPPVKSRLWDRLTERYAVKSRIEITKTGWEFYKQRPILGYGLGGFELLTGARFKPEHEFYGMQRGVITGVFAHNEYTKLLVEGGVVALIAFFFLIYRALKLSVRLFKLPISTAKNYGVFLIAMTTGMVVGGIPGGGFDYVAFYFWIFMAVGEVYFQQFQAKA